MKIGKIIVTALENLAGFLYEDAQLSPFGLFILFALPTIALVALIKVLIDYFKE